MATVFELTREQMEAVVDLATKMVLDARATNTRITSPAIGTPPAWFDGTPFPAKQTLFAEAPSAQPVGYIRRLTSGPNVSAYAHEGPFGSSASA